MEKKSLGTRFILPPNVKGRCRGILALGLQEINWHSEEPFQFNSIQAKLIWWGDKTGATLKLDNKRQLKKSNGHVIKYNILTKPTLFRNYLKSAESIEIKFSSYISNVDIGKSIVSIPIELIESSDQLKQTARKFPKKYHIFNASNKVIGDLVLEFDMQLYDRVLSEAEMDMDKCTENIGVENDMNQFNLELDFERNNPFKKTHKKKSKTKTSQKTDKSIEKSSVKQLSSNSTISTPLLNYLTGRPLGKIEENDAVKAMESTSPTESLIDLLSFDLNGLFLPKKMNNAESKVLEKIDCLRVQVYSLCLTRAGTREILSKNESTFSSGTFSVDIDLDSILSTRSPFEKNTVFTSQITRIFSSSIEKLPPSINFNQSAVDKLNTFCIKSRNSYANGIISLTIHYRDIESSESRILGVARVQLASVIQAANLTFQQQCPVTTTASEIVIGRLLVKVELGCRGLHFGADFLEAISSNAIDGSKHKSSYCSSQIQYTDISNRFDDDREYMQSHKCLDCYESEHRMNDLFCNACAYDQPTDNKSGTPSTPLNIESHSSMAQWSINKNVNNFSNDAPGKDITHGLSNMDELTNYNDNKLNGLFHIGQIDYCSWYQSSAETFLVCRPFWSESALVTENCSNENTQLNYLELFAVICDQKLQETTKHGFMSIEVWQRESNQTNNLIGSAKVPLHQFYIAFNNNSIRNHVNQQELPVISIDGWITIAYAASPSTTPVGTVQAILAVGTTQQINHFKRFKGLSSCKNFIKHPLDLYPPQSNQPNSNPIPTVSSESNRNLGSNMKAQLPQFNDRSSNLASMLSNFIDTLAARLPDRNLSATEIATTTNDATTQTTKNVNNSVAIDKSAPPEKYMRPTSELLDELQKALSVAPTPAQRSAIPHATAVPTSDQTTKSEQKPTTDAKKETMFRVHFEIERALHLPSISTHVSKKSGKRNKHSDLGRKCDTMEIQPSTYSSFEAAASPADSMMHYVTNVIENSCSPQWNKQFEIFLPVEFLQNDEKRFVIRVMRETKNNTSKARPKQPHSSNDVTVGCATVDLSVLLAGLPTISGWFNIIDHSGCINGQIKVHIKPKDDLMIYQKHSKPQPMLIPPPIVPAVRESEELDEMPMSAAEVTSTESQTIADSVLSRALKRKFTELEEISQRLRARLFDVTVDPDDEFENDLNTIPDEEDDFEDANIASDLSLDWLEHCQNQASSNEPSLLESSIATQMQDIFDFLSPDQICSPTNAPKVESMSVDLLNNQLNCHYNAVLNDENACNETKVDDVDKTLKNIAESLQKSLLKD